MMTFITAFMPNANKLCRLKPVPMLGRCICFFLLWITFAVQAQSLSLGPEQSKKAFVHYPAHTFPGQEEELKDDTHFNTYGAYQIAQCVLLGIRKEIPALAQHITDGVPVYDPAKPDAIDQWRWPESPRFDLTTPDGN